MTYVTQGKLFSNYLSSIGSAANIKLNSYRDWIKFLEKNKLLSRLLNHDKFDSKPSFKVLLKLEKAQCRPNSGKVYMYLVNGIVVNRPDEWRAHFNILIL